MSNYHPSVQEYIRACEALLKIGELSDAEALVVEKMMDRLSDDSSAMASRSSNGSTTPAWKGG